MSKYKQPHIDEQVLKSFEDIMRENNIETLPFKTIEEFRKNFDMDLVLLYFMSGRLLSWLDDHFYEDEAEKVEQLSEDDSNLCEKLCKILGVDPAKYVESFCSRNNQIKQLGKYVDNPADYVDATAFDQEELASLLKDGASTIYLCDNTFTIPLRKKGKTYIGFGNAIALIHRDEPIDLDATGITFKNLQIENHNGIIFTDKTPEELFRLAKEADKNYARYVDELQNVTGQEFKRVVELSDKARSDMFKFYKRAAELGNSEAMYELAGLYQVGIGAEEDISKAIQWYETSATIGHVDSMLTLGKLYTDGDKVPKNLRQAIHWYEMAADSGSIFATKKLGDLYYRGGDDLEEDPHKAFELLKKVAESGENASYVRDAMTTLGNMYRFGNGVEKDDFQARYWYEKSGYADYMRRRYNQNYGTRNQSGCFITTAVCDSLGKSDDCFELTTFRKFRDGWLTAQSDGKVLIAEYYAVAPQIVAKINSLADAAQIYEKIRQRYLEPCLNFIGRGDNISCKNTYVAMVNDLKRKYL